MPLRRSSLLSAVGAALAAAGIVGCGLLFVAPPAPSRQPPAVAGRLRGSAGKGPDAQAPLGSGAGAGMTMAALGALILAARELSPGAPRGAVRRGVATVDPTVTASDSSTGGPKPGEFAVTSQVGITAPFGAPGESYWDPLGFCAGVDEATFRQYRTAELKHGRVSMAALIGLINQHFWRFGGIQLRNVPEADGWWGFTTIDYNAAPGGVYAAVSEPSSSSLGLLVLLAGFFELRFWSDDVQKDKEVGDFGDPLDIMARNGIPYDAQWRNFEINHGRLAMFGIIGAIVAEMNTGLDIFDQLKGWKAPALAYIKTTIPWAP